MKLYKEVFIAVFLLMTIVLLSNFSSAYLSTTNVQTSQYSVGSTTNFSSAMCQNGQDFIIQISPFGCTPAVVRTDLLEENDVQVYCQLGATRINPLIEVSTIDSISFAGSYPPEVSGIGFHPAKAALGVEEQLNTPILDNIGYVIITLKKQTNASAIPEYVSGNLTAKISYNIKTALGIGKALFYIPEFNDDEEWEAKRYKYSFWGNKGYLKVEEINNDGAQISVYTESKKISTVNLKKGETSQNIYLPDFECQAGLKLKLESLDISDTRAQLRINSEVVEVAKNEKFLDNKCQVKNLLSNGLVQKIGLKCQEDDGVKNFDLTISPKLILNIGGGDEEVELGEKLYEEGDKSIYLGFIGTKDNSKKTEDLFVYLVSMSHKKDKLTEDEIAKITSIVGDLTSAGQKSTGILSKVNDALKKFGGLATRLEKLIVEQEIFYRINFEDKNQEAFGKKISIIDFAEAQDIELTDTLKEAYQNAKEDYETIKEGFASEKYGTGTYGEEALHKEIKLALSAGQKKTAYELCQEFYGNYPNSKKDLSMCADSYKFASQETGETYITINNEIRQIFFDGISEPSFEDYGASIIINSPKESDNFDLRKSQLVSGTGFSLQLISLEENSAKIQISAVTEKGTTTTKTLNLVKDVTKEFIEGYSFTLTKVNLKKIAKISVLPNINSAGSQANFSFKIGIEKRAINLTPETIKQSIEDLNKSINVWQNISDVLGNVTQGLKTACLATGAALVVKNFIVNAGGAGTARQYVMRGTDGWFEECTSRVNAGTYTSIDNCLVENADKIDKDVETISNIITQQNNKIQKIEQGITTQDFLSEAVVNTSAFMEEYSEQVINYIEDNTQFQGALTDPSGRGNDINEKDILTSLSYEAWKKDIYNTEQLRDIELYTKILNDPSSGDELVSLAKSRLYSTLNDVQTNAGNFAEATKLANNIGISSDKIGWLEIGKDVKSISYNELTLKDVEKTINGVDSNTPVYLAQASDGKTYLFILDNSAKTSKLTIKKTGEKFMIYDYNTMNIVDSPARELTNVYFQKYDSSSYNNQYQNAELQYYETEPYTGLPAIVPFDLKNGWYASIKQTINSGSNIASYEESGRVSSFYLCNIGENGLEENIGGDDICEMINTGTGQPYDQFPGLDETESKTQINKAIQAIEQASKVSDSQRTGSVSILGQKIKIGEPAVDLPDFQCQDFMSPKECLLLFNICDPVICPSSRCDLGGTFPVQDVVQSGVIGSIVLCLPNIQEGIVMPVCLTGIKAGIDGFLSIKQAYKDCLQESLDTGEMVGICDEIYSIYICDFFWKQVIPFADLIIPKIIEAILGQGIGGGGEYLNVANAWEGASDAVNYFVNYYGTNAKDAFLARTTEEFTDEVCSLYASAVIPSGADFISSLTTPDSPTQFHGRFDEIKLTTATVPPTSQYKVFYHIYAGKDSGAYYQVYLKGVAESSYYQDTASSFMVASGYIAVGGYASETKDFVATSGYQELCINVNGEEECGFEEVSTSFAFDYIEDEYLASQASETDITTERECISGTASLYSLLNPNVQSAVEEVIDPEVYNEGIIRICATDNPGKGTDPYANTEEARWVDVGYCDNTNMRCWIDTESIENIIKSTTVEGETLDTVAENYIKILKNQEGYLSEEEFLSSIEEIKSEEDSSKKVILINEIIDKVFWSKEKVELLYLRGNAYTEIFDGLFGQIEKPISTFKEEEEEATTITQKEEKDLQEICADAVNNGIFENIKECTQICKQFVELDVYTDYNDCVATIAAETAKEETEETSTEIQTICEEAVTEKIFSTKETCIEFCEERVNKNVYGSYEECIYAGLDKNTWQIIGDARKAVLMSARDLEGKSSSSDIYSNCWEAAYEIYKRAEVSDSCIYSDKANKEYQITLSTGTTKNIIMGVSAATFDTSLDCSNYPNCVPFGVLSCQHSSNENNFAKLDNIQSGDLISYIWDNEWGHNAIFVKWIDKDSKKALLFDWNGYIWSGEKSSSGFVCTSINQDSNWEKHSSKPYCKIFRYYEETLSDNKHPVYIYWQPSLAGTATAESFLSDKENFNLLESPNLETESSAVPSEEVPSSGIITTLGTKIFDEANSFYNNQYNEVKIDERGNKIYDEVDAKFVAHCISKAGISFDVQEDESMDDFVKSIESNNDFSEVEIKDVKKGDIIFLGKKCQLHDSVGIVITPLTEGLIYYTDTGAKERVLAKTITDTSKITNELYPYKAYRYVGDLSTKTFELRTKWTLYEAIKTVGTRTGKYDANKVFVDHLVFDRILTEQECGDITGTSGILNGLLNAQKDMNWLRKLLIAKCAQDDICSKYFE